MNFKDVDDINIGNYPIKKVTIGNNELWKQKYIYSLKSAKVVYSADDKLLANASNYAMIEVKVEKKYIDTGEIKKEITLFPEVKILSGIGVVDTKDKYKVIWDKNKYGITEKTEDSSITVEYNIKEYNISGNCYLTAEKNIVTDASGKIIIGLAEDDRVELSDDGWYYIPKEGGEFIIDYSAELYETFTSGMIREVTHETVNGYLVLDNERSNIVWDNSYNGGVSRILEAPPTRFECDENTTGNYRDVGINVYHRKYDKIRSYLRVEQNG